MLYKLVLLLAFALLIPGGIAQNSTGCMPASCRARCDPGCSSGQVCTLGTMTQCGQCPASRCIDRSILNPSSSSAGAGSTQSASSDSNGNSNDTSSSNGALIGGLVGGLVGGALVFAILGYCFIKRNKSTKATTLLPFLSQQQQQHHHHHHHHHQGSNASQNQQHMTTRQANSGVISVSYVPPNRHSTQLQTSQSDAASNRRHSSYLSVRDHRASRYDTDDETLETGSQRTSLASSVSNQPTTPAKASQAVQVVRARPQIMRVNQVRIDSVDGSSTGGLSRSGSVRTILTREENPSMTSVQLSRSRTAPTRRMANRRESSSILVITPQERPNTIINVDDEYIDRSLLSAGTASISVDNNSFDNRTATSLSTPADENNPFHDRHSVDGSCNAKIHPIIEVIETRSQDDVTPSWNRNQQPNKRASS